MLSRCLFCDSCVEFDTTCAARIGAGSDSQPLGVSIWAEFHHGQGTRGQPGWQWRGSLTRIRRQGRSRFVQAVIQGFKEVPHGRQGVSIEVGSHLFPKQAFAAPFRPGRLEQWATQLLHLIHQKRQHHQRGKHHGEMLIAMAEIVLEMIALILQCTPESKVPESRHTHPVETQWQM